jgi:dihydroxyacetone kinase
VSRVATVIGEDMDGTSGALYAIYLNALAFSLRKVTQEKKSQMTAEKWAEALQIASESLKTYTPARPGDRTLIDALYPFVKVLGTSGSVKTAAKAAMEGADRTKGMRASLGRTVYVGGEGWQNVPDPGAFGLSVFLDGLASAL